MIQNPANQLYGIQNEPLPPTPTFKQTSSQQQQPNSMMFSNQQPNNSAIKSVPSSQQQLQQSINIVGPSDHYGSLYHPFGTATSGSHDNNHLNDKNNNDNLNNRDAKQALGGLPRSQLETKVCVIVDSRTPVIIKVPIPPTQITLGDLKQALPAIDQPKYNYFFKSNDSEFGIVKEGIQDDDSLLPSYRNRVVAWIVTKPGRLGDEPDSRTKSETDTCNLTYSNTSYDDGSSSLMTTDIESTSYFTETDDDSISCSDYSETTCDTLISQRRNRHPKSNSKSPVHHYHHDHRNSPYRYNNLTTRDREIGNRSPSSSPTTSSSASQSDATAVHCLTVHLVLTNENFLGLHIYANAINGVDEGIYVDGVTEHSAIALDGRIEPGDKLIQVNEINLEELSNEEAVRVVKEAVIKRGPLKLVVAKFVETNKNDNVDSLVGPKDAIHPIDTAAWVAHAQAITMPNSHSATSSPSFGSNAQDTDCIRPASAGITRLTYGLRLNRGTTDIKDIVQHMMMPNIGLDIRDREWLKIHIPRAFLGSELVTWLERNVYGFNNNREAKKFASRLLKEGYIRDPIAKKSFSSKSYYTFVL